MKVVNESEFHTLVKEQPLVLVDFFATWCGPCKMLAPVLEDVAKSTEGKLTIVKVDVDQENGLAMQYGIMSVPTMILFKDGKAIQQIQGYQPAPQLLGYLQPYL